MAKLSKHTATIITVVGALVLIGIIVVASILTYTSNEDEQSQSESSGNEVNITAEVLEFTQWSLEDLYIITDSYTGLSFPGYGTIVIPSDQSSVDFLLYNPDLNDCSVVFEISVDEIDEVLYTSDELKPGEIVETITFSQELEVGTYTLNVSVTPVESISSQITDSSLVKGFLVVQ